MKFDVIALGELLVDFAGHGESEQGNQIYEACPGGAPCNVLAMLNRLGRKTAFVGKVGEDQFGALLRKTITDVGIDASHLIMDKEVNTTLAFVHTLEHGDRDFSFYRNPGADMMLREEEIPEEFIKDTTIFHFGTLSMTHPEVRQATKKALRIAKASGCLISFDPNLRPPLWRSQEVAKEQMAYGFSRCDILKIADNEIQFFTGKDNYDEGIAYLQDRYQIPLILLTLGKEGSRAYYQDMRITRSGFACETIETTGAGDTFCACILHAVLEHGLYNLTDDKIYRMLSFANAAAALVTTRKGALRAMPDEKEVLDFIEASQNTSRDTIY